MLKKERAPDFDWVRVTKEFFEITLARFHRKKWVYQSLVRLDRANVEGVFCGFVLGLFVRLRGAGGRGLGAKTRFSRLGNKTSTHRAGVLDKQQFDRREATPPPEDREGGV